VPMIAGGGDLEPVTVFMAPVPNWSDGTPGPMKMWQETPRRSSLISSRVAGATWAGADRHLCAGLHREPQRRARPRLDGHAA